MAYEWYHVKNFISENRARLSRSKFSDSFVRRQWPPSESHRSRRISVDGRSMSGAKRDKACEGRDREKSRGSEWWVDQPISLCIGMKDTNLLQQGSITYVSKNTDSTSKCPVYFNRRLAVCLHLSVGTHARLLEQISTGRKCLIIQTAGDRLSSSLQVLILFDRCLRVCINRYPSDERRVLIEERKKCNDNSPSFRSMARLLLCDRSIDRSLRKCDFDVHRSISRMIYDKFSFFISRLGKTPDGDEWIVWRFMELTVKLLSLEQRERLSDRAGREREYLHGHFLLMTVDIRLFFSLSLFALIDQVDSSSSKFNCVETAFNNSISSSNDSLVINLRSMRTYQVCLIYVIFFFFWLSRRAKQNSPVDHEGLLASAFQSRTLIGIRCRWIQSSDTDIDLAWLCIWDNLTHCASRATYPYANERLCLSSLSLSLSLSLSSPF